MSTWNTAAGRRRKSELPANWPALRKQTLEDCGYRCTEVLDSGQRCPEPATDADHIGDKHDHSRANRRGLCTWHHDAKTAAQGAEKRGAFLSKLKHPGL